MERALLLFTLLAYSHAVITLYQCLMMTSYAEAAEATLPNWIINDVYEFSLTFSALWLFIHICLTLTRWNLVNNLKIYLGYNWAWIHYQDMNWRCTLNRRDLHLNSCRNIDIFSTKLTHHLIALCQCHDWVKSECYNITDTLLKSSYFWAISIIIDVIVKKCQ